MTANNLERKGGGGGTEKELVRILAHIDDQSKEVTSDHFLPGVQSSFFA